MCLQISAYLSVTVYIEDVNDNVPKFQDTPYHVAVDELTPTGKTDLLYDIEIHINQLHILKLKMS